MNSLEKWENFVREAQELIESKKLQKSELAFLEERGRKVGVARKAVLSGTDDWVQLVKDGLKTYLIAHSDYSKVCAWIDRRPDDALAALGAIWTNSEVTVLHRVDGFCKLVPSEVLSGSGPRLNVASVLLMGMDVERYPYYWNRTFQEAYRRTGYDQPDWGGEEAPIYQHALDFLDRFVEEAFIHGLILSNRLEMISLIKPLLDDLPVLSKDTPPHLTNDLLLLAERLHLSPSFLENIEMLLEDKRQVIFHGPPGTGKTYVAHALAHCLAGSEERVTLVQFHPSYAYEDFVRGFRPTVTKKRLAGFRLQDGPLIQAAKRARKDEGKELAPKHFLIIDEINRGNLARIFGELYYLLEYRDREVYLQYQRSEGETFSMPENLFIIGTMNTADRSIALVDLALRRRFYFVKFHPDDEPVKGVLRRWLGEGSELEWIADVVEQANKLLEENRHAAIGPSYFMKEGLDKKMVERIWKHSVRPYIEEQLMGDDRHLEQFDLKTLCEQVAPVVPMDDDEKQIESEA